MRFLQSLIACLLLIGSVSSAQAQLQTTSPLAPPEVRAWSDTSRVERDTTGATITRITVEVPADHHGYLDAGDEGLLIPISFTFADPGLVAEEIARPQGTRDEQAHATVLRGRGEFVFRFDAQGVDNPSPNAKLRYQICNDVTNICYPPRTVDVPFQLAAAQSPTTPPPERTQSESESPPVDIASGSFRERLADSFRQSTNNLFFAIALVFIAGLIVSATPCVYPIIPITSAILMARGGGSPRIGQLHALIYFLGLIFFYTLLGVFAVTTGTALSAVMTNPWVNLGFAVLFVYLGLSMLGLYEFQFMPALTARLDSASSQRSGLSGTFMMGTTAGLVVSPCVGPVVGAILLDITGQAAATANAANTAVASDVIVRGIALMTSFGAGLGIPFLVVGLLSHRLPQSGAWLSKVKFLLGLPILYFAYTYYIKSLETLGVPANVAHAMLVGVVAIVLAVFIGGLHLQATGDKPLQLRRACGIILLVIGVHFLYNGLGRSGILINVSAPDRLVASTSAPVENEVEIHGNLRWLRNVAAARQLARAESKPMFVDFYATWCANCKAFNRLALQHKELNRVLEQSVLLKVYDTDPDFKIFQQDERFPELRGVGGQPFLPLFAVYSPQGKFIWKGQDYQAADTMIAQLERVRHAALR